MAYFFDRQITGSDTSNYDISLYELDDESPMYPCEAIEGTAIVLKPHQRSLLHRCMMLENEQLNLSDSSISSRGVSEYCGGDDWMHTKVGVLADRVGAGKSYVLLALLLVNDLYAEDGDVTIKSYGLNNVVFNIHRYEKIIRTNLLVVPHNLVSQWTSYIQQFPGLTHTIINKKTYEAFIADEIDISTYNLVLVTSTYYNMFANHINDKKQYIFQRVIYDEVDHLSIPSCRRTLARFTWFVTASFGNVLYPRGFARWESSVRRYIWNANGIAHSGYIKNMLNDIFANVPRELSKIIIVKNKDSFVDHSIRLPPVKRNVVMCKTPATIRVLNGIADRTVIECLNANDIQGAISHINPTHKSSEANIIDVLITKYTKQLSNLELRLVHTQEYLYETEAERQNEIDKVTKKIQEVKHSIDMIKKRIMETDTCIICYDDISNKTITPCCQNSFCFKCITSWLTKNKASCPLCKKHMNIDDLYVICNEGAGTLSQDVVTKAKVDHNALSNQWDKYKNLKILLRNRKPNSKFLIFSNYDYSFVNIYDILNEENIGYEHLKGNGNVVKCTVDRYKNGVIDVLLVNSSHYGSGLNLENTTDIVMFHKFDTEIEKQVIGRADRYGRTHELNVWYLLYDSEQIHTSSP